MTREIPKDVRMAIETMKGDSADPKARLKASGVIDGWVGDGGESDFIDRDQEVKKAFTDVPGSGAMASPIKGTTRSGSSTAPIPPTVNGTGIPSQVKRPIDLRG